MSGKQTGKVWDLDVSGRQQLVLLALADNAHHDGTHCFPGNDLLAWKTGYSVRTIKRVLAELRDPAASAAAGHEGPLVEAVNHARGGRGHRTEYHLHLDRGKRKEPYDPIARKQANLAPKERVPERPAKGDSAPPERVTPETVNGDTHARASTNRPDPLGGTASGTSLARVQAREVAGNAGEGNGQPDPIFIPRGTTPRTAARLRRTASRLGAEIHDGSTR